MAINWLRQSAQRGKRRKSAPGAGRGARRHRPADLARLGPVIEQDTLAMHGVMMTSTPSLLYWEPGSLEIMRGPSLARRTGHPRLFTIDTGPNIHLIL
ncbi:MAG: hypothetical protein R2851_07855 [Caldilineaceae bacterium]